MVAGNASHGLGPKITRRRRQDAMQVGGLAQSSRIPGQQAAQSAVAGSCGSSVGCWLASALDAAGTRVLTLDLPFRRDESNLALVLAASPAIAYRGI